MVIYHNPRCAKSREGLAALRAAGIEPEIRLYFEEPLTTKEIKSLLTKLKLSPEAIMRKGEADYKLFIKGKELTHTQLLDALVKYPKLIERPIVETKDKAVVGRPLDNILNLIA